VTIFFLLTIPLNSYSQARDGVADTSRLLKEIYKPTNWIARGGCWDFSKRIITAQAYIGCCRAYYARRTFKDCTFEVRLNKLAEDGSTGLLLRYNEATNEGYIFELWPHGGHMFAIFKGDKRYALQRTTPVIVMKRGYNTWNTVKIVCTGPEFAIFINGSHVDTVTDHTYSSGRVGLRVHGDPRQRAKFEILSLTAR